MDRDCAFELVAEAIAKEFGVDKSSVKAETVSADVAGWDSFSHGMLILTLEDRLNTVLPVDRLLEAANVGELVDIVERVAK